MNAAIRAVVRTGIAKGWEVFGVRNGYAGLCDGQMDVLGARDVGNILQRGGTFLGSARLPEFKDEAVRARGLAQLNARGIDGLVVIGGNGTQTGALALSKAGLPVVGVASTIDNDLAGSRDDHRRRHGAQHRARGDRPAAGDRLVAQARVPGRGDGAQLRLPGADGRHRRRRRLGGHPRGRRRARGHRPEPAGGLGARQAARDGGGGRGGQAQRRQAGAALRARKGAAGIRPARDHARPRAARRRAGGVRSPAGDAAGGGGDRMSGSRRARLPGGAHSRRGAHDAARRGGRQGKTIDLKLLQLQKVLAQ